MGAPFEIEQSRAIPVTVPTAFDGTLPLALTTLFRRRYGLLPPIKEVRDQQGTWGAVGQTRTIVTADGGTMRERLVEVDAPRSFSYRISDLTGPLRPLIVGADGNWTFEPTGTGTLVTWRWTLHPRGVGVPVMPVFAAMWRGYARQALELLSGELLAPGSGERSTT